MPATDDAGDGHNGFLPMIRETREQVQTARWQYFQEKLSGRVSHSARQELAQAALLYYDVLWEYVDNDQGVHQAWQDSDVDLIQQKSHETVTTTAGTPGRGSAKQYREENALVAMDPDTLVELTKKLDYFASEMGFGASPNDGRDLGRIGGAERWGEEGQDDE